MAAVPPNEIERASQPQGSLPACQDTVLFHDKPAQETSFPALPPPRVPAQDPVAPVPSAIPQPGTMIGNYEVIQPLGRGGMGVVFLGRQRPLDRLVALKVLAFGSLQEASVRARFETEAKVAAGLTHPNIAQVIELGQSDSGPFIAMEYVSGPTLAQHQAGEPQAAQQAAELVRTLALAAQFAHENGVIHRDLKPANILLTTEGAPKIVDFGLAKVLESTCDETRTGDILGTPAYMAPEQASGAKKLIGPRCDIYALGVILYETLVGRPPFRGPDAMSTVFAVLSSDPVPPSRLVSTVPRDLETICLKCLEKHPHNRYRSARELADDLQRFLSGLPILALPPTLSDRMWKWARRKPATAALIVTVFLAIANFMVFSTWKNRELSQALVQTRLAQERSERNFRAALEAALRRIERVGQDPAKMLDEELAFFDSIRHQQQTDTASRYECALAARCVGDLLRKLHRDAQAGEAYAEAKHLLQSLTEQNKSASIYRRDLAGINNQLALLHQDAGHLELAEQSLRQGLAEFEALSTSAPDDQDYYRQQASVWNNLGVLAGQQKDPEKAVTCFERAIQLREILIRLDPRRIEYHSELVEVQNNLATALMRSGKRSEAIEALKQVIEQHLQLPDTIQSQAKTRFSKAGSYLNLGAVLDQVGQQDQAIQQNQIGVSVLQSLTSDYPTVPSYQQALADAELNQSKIWLARDDLKKALAGFESALERYRSLATNFPSETSYRAMVDRLLPGIDQVRNAVKSLPESELRPRAAPLEK